MARKRAPRKAAATKRTTERARENTASELQQQNEDAASGNTEPQQEMIEYHKGAFQTHDPITGEERDLDEPIRVAHADRGETVEDIVREQNKK